MFEADGRPMVVKPVKPEPPEGWLQRVTGQDDDSGVASAPSTQTTGEG